MRCRISRRAGAVVRSLCALSSVGILAGAMVHPVAAQQADDAVLDAPAMLGAKKPDPSTLAGNKSRTRFVIGLERVVDFQVFSLSNPNRVVVELPDIKLMLPTMSGDAPVGLVQSFRGGSSAPGKMRVVIDVISPVVVEKAGIDKSKEGGHALPRLVLDIVSVDAAAKGAATPKKAAATTPSSGLGAVGLQPPLPRPAQRPEQRSANIFRPMTESNFLRV